MAQLAGGLHQSHRQEGNGGFLVLTPELTHSGDGHLLY